MDLVEFWYREPGYIENDGLVQVMGDKEVLQMLNSIPEGDRVIKLYLLHCGGINFLEGNCSGVQDTNGGRK